MAGAASGNKSRRPSHPHLPPLPHTLAHGDDGAPSPSRHVPSLPIAARGTPRSARLSSSGAVYIPPTVPNSDVFPPSGIAPFANDGAGERQLPNIARPAACGVSRVHHVIGIARGMKPLPLRVKAILTPTPASSLEHQIHAAAEAAERPLLTTAVAEEDPLHLVRMQPRPPSPTLSQQQASIQFSDARPQRPGGPLRRPHPPSMGSVPAVYRPTATQFLMAVRRLNRMTANVCRAEDKTSLEFVEEDKGKRLNRRPESNGATLHAAPTPPLSLPRVRKLAHVPLLPLTICTDGSAVLLVDPNGTSRHGNYVQAAETYLQCRAAAHPSTPPAASCMLWWTMDDVKGCRGVLPLSDARASYTEGDPSFGMSSSSSALSTSTHANTRIDCNLFLSSVQPSCLKLPYGEGLLLLFTNASASSTKSADVSPATAPNLASAPASSFSHGFLDDLYHGYLPSLLESVYPDGGVQIRGCWCDSWNSSGESTISSTKQPLGASFATSQPSVAPGDGARSSRGREPDDDVKTLRIAEPLVHPACAPSTRVAETTKAPSSELAAAAAARIMERLQPTSLPRAPASSKGTPINSLSQAPILELPKAVLQFMLHEDDVASPQMVQRVAGASAVKELTGASRSIAPRSPAMVSSPSAPTVDESERIVGSDKRKFDTTAAPSCFSSGGLVFVSPLLRAPQPVRVAAAAAAASSCAAVDDRPSLCHSVIVLTPMGRVELVVEHRGARPLAGDAAASAISASPVTIRDVKSSLCLCAVGQALQLSEADVALVYAPGTAALGEEEELNRKHVVLRLRRRLVCGYQ
ncbi:hypothetical protein ABL78_7801 [Leptomonas seymouri]|uniref:Uncharacterized protein n=1 Tax=Leptomonas seymouri TaxID=5684 RepID=A0A0N1I1G3_LEPSE|nr:hypothetical protein ABL78_7801 [Leptomonas seymouri]|eukprot:KPI83172.1 hypothetical protein ABL78_7801 [Leptomonas seymouri]